MVPGRPGPLPEGSLPMIVIVKRVGEAVEVLQGASSLPEGEEIVLFTASDLIDLDRERREEVDLQMPSFLRGAEDEDAEELFHL
jgi:hypothetical protein